MTIKLNLRTGVILLAALAILIGGIAYAASQISRGVSGSFIVGQVQTAAGTILLYSQITPSSADLTSVNFGTGDIDAFGNFATISTIPFWAANGGGVPFNLTVQATDVEVSRSGSPIATGSGILTLQMGPAGGALVKYPDHATTIATGGDPVAMEMDA